MIYTFCKKSVAASYTFRTSADERLCPQYITLIICLFSLLLTGKTNKDIWSQRYRADKVICCIGFYVSSYVHIRIIKNVWDCLETRESTWDSRWIIKIWVEFRYFRISQDSEILSESTWILIYPKFIILIRQ